MQNEISRLLQKSYSFLKTLEGHPLIEAREAVENALILNPDLPAARLAEVIANEMDPDAARALGQVLIQSFLLTAIRSQRRENPASESALLPGFEHLPPKIPTHKGKVIELLDANYWGVLGYYWTLMRQVKKRNRENVRVKEARKLVELMARAAHDDHGATVREVVLIDRVL